MYDLIIVGGGPGGYLAAERAGKAGLSVLLLEKRELGGVCLNEGCIPSKALLHSAKLFDNARYSADFGVTVETASLDHRAVIARKDKVVATLVSGVRSALRSCKVKVIDGEAFILDASNIKVNNEVYTGKRLIIATGSTPVIPPIAGVSDALSSGFALTSREILDLQDFPAFLTIVGGGVIGLEMAAYYNSAGSKVTVIEMLPKIAGALDAGISEILLKSYRQKGVEFILEARVTKITDNGVEYISNSAEQGTIPSHLKADKVLLAIGRKPLIEGFGLENTGVVIEGGAIKTDRHGLTSIPAIYAVGDVNGRYMLAHTAYREAEVAVNHILGINDIMRYDSIPSVIYTSPEVASVGETEETANAKGIEFDSVTLPMTFSGRYVAENAVTDGICKILLSKSQRNILGVHAIGSYVSEIIISAGIMIEMQMRVDDIKELVFPHPTISEIIREAIFKF